MSSLRSSTNNASGPGATLRTPRAESEQPDAANGTDGKVDLNQPLSAEETDLAVAELRYQTAFYLEVVQAMANGTELGAEQVQDKRIELLEQGPPPVDPSATILLFAITLILEGSVGPALAGAVTRGVLRPIVRMFGKAITVQQRRSIKALAKEIRLFRSYEPVKVYKNIKPVTSASQQRELRLITEQIKQAADDLKQELRGQIGKTRRVRDALTNGVTFVQENLVAGVQSARVVAEPSGSPERLRAGDSPGVAIQAAAHASASRFRLTIRAIHEALEAELKRPGITAKEVISILEDYRIDTQVDLAVIRDNFQLATEAMIWAQLLLTQDNIDKARDRAERAAGRDLPGREIAWRLLTGEGPGMTDDDFLKFNLGVDKRVVAYLLTRFRQDILRWIAEKKKIIPIRKAYSSPAGPQSDGSQPAQWWDEKKYDNERIDFLVQYLAEVKESTPELKLW